MSETSAIPESRPLSAWRRCVMLCVPALILGAILRISLLTALPEGYYGPDSNSYFDTTSALWLKHHWDMGPKRRWVYPLLLLPTPILPGRNVATIAFVQHIVGLLVTVLGMGWITFHLTRRPIIWVPFVTIIAGLWPRMIWYEHEIVAEPILLASIIFTIALAFPVQRLREPRRLFWFLMSAALIIAIKPHGRPIWLGLMLAAVILAGFPWRWSWPCWGALAVSAVVILTTGSSKQGPWLLLSSTLPLVDTEHGKWPEYRKILSPYIQEARVDISQYPWKQDRYKKMLVESGDKSAQTLVDSGDKSAQVPVESGGRTKLGDEWQAMLKERKKTKFLTVCGDLAKDAIVHNPLTYAQMVLRKIGMVLSDDESGWRMSPRAFWKGQIEDNEERWQKHADEMQMLYELDEPGYHALAEQRQAVKPWYERFVYNFTKTFAWMHTTRLAGIRTLHSAWFGLLALFGILTCFRPGRWRETSLLWLPLGLYLVIIFAIGDSVSRYLQPIEWVGIIFVALGFDWVLQWIWRSPPEAPPSSPPASAVVS